MPIAVRPNATAASGSRTSTTAVEDFSSPVQVAKRPCNQVAKVSEAASVGPAVLAGLSHRRAATPARQIAHGIAIAMNTSMLTMASAR